MKSIIKKWIVLFLLASGVMSTSLAAGASQAGAFYFMIIDHPGNKPVQLEKELAELRNRTPAFVVLNGIKSRTESCTDGLYTERKELLDEVSRPVIVSLSARDWVYCRNIRGNPVPMERLIRLREILFDSKHSLGKQPVNLTRQSLNIRFSAYAENYYWKHGPVMFATLHLPANNNNYLAAAGRNNEFEDRTIANKNWLDLIFRQANRQRAKAIVLFSDGNPYQIRNVSRDGYSEIRQKLNTLVSGYSGRVLIIHGQPGPVTNDIVWKGKLGITGAGSDWTRISVTPNSAAVFKIETAASKTQGRQKKTRRKQ